MGWWGVIRRGGAGDPAPALVYVYGRAQADHFKSVSAAALVLVISLVNVSAVNSERVVSCAWIPS